MILLGRSGRRRVECRRNEMIRPWPLMVEQRVIFSFDNFCRFAVGRWRRRAACAMCGIVGYVGHRRACDVVLDASRRMEYRGYDPKGRGASNGVVITSTSRMPAKHQRRQRVIDHRLVIHRRQLLARARRDGMQPGPGPTRQMIPRTEVILSKCGGTRHTVATFWPVADGLAATLPHLTVPSRRDPLSSILQMASIRKSCCVYELSYRRFICLRCAER